MANNAVSLAQAHFTPEAWYRAIYAGETPVGFMMLDDDPAKPEYLSVAVAGGRPLSTPRLRPAGHREVGRLCQNSPPRRQGTARQPQQGRRQPGTVLRQPGFRLYGHGSGR